MTIKQLMRVSTILTLCTNIAPAIAGGTIVTDGFVSNFVSRSPNNPDLADCRRLFNVYLPAAFFQDPTATFPIVYHLTGAGGDNTSFSASDKAAMDMMLQKGEIQPLIIIAPDPSEAAYDGSFYVNSLLNGQFESYIVQELIPFVDAKYRQRRTASGDARPFRAIMGQSMGAYGSLYYGVKHPELFIAHAADSATAFWLVTTNLAAPPAPPEFPDGNPMYELNKTILPEIQRNGNQISPFNPNSPETVAFYPWPAAFSPVSNGLTQCGPPDAPPCKDAFPFCVAYPFQVNADGTVITMPTSAGPSLIPNQSIINLWQTFDPYFLLDTANLELIRRQAIYLDAGAAKNADGRDLDELDNVGARFMQDKLISLNINNQYLLFDGGHISCISLAELECYRFTTNLKLFSGKFSEAGIFAPDVRTKITGNQVIELTGNAVMSINNKRLVGIETNPALGVTDTNITFRILDSARLEIGNATTIGGALQVGNAFGKANLQFNPSLLNNTVSCTFELNGPEATLQIGRQGYLGCAVGIDGNQTIFPNFWGVSSLANVVAVNFNLIQGSFIHNNIASSLDPKAALFAIGDSIDRNSQYSFTFDPKNVVIAGGANLAKITLANLLHPTVLTTAGSIPPGGIYGRQVFEQGLFDSLFGPPKGMISSTTIYTNTLTVGILSSSAMLLDTRKQPLPNPATTGQLFTYLEVDDYFNQGTKRAPIAELDGIITVAYELPQNGTGQNGTDTIVREAISTTDPCSPIRNANVAKILQDGAVGIKLVTVNGKKTILRLYDLDPKI